MGRWDESIREASRAVELDPFAAHSIQTLASMYYFARQYDQALLHARKCTEMFPENSACYFWLTRILQAKGMYDQEVPALQKVLTLNGEKEKDVVAPEQLYEAGGIRDVWRWEIERVKAKAARDEFARAELASLYALLGERDQALGWLQKAYAGHDDVMYSIKTDPNFDSLRSDPRFQGILRRMNFP